MAVVSIGTRGGKGKAEQEEGLFQQYILRRIARVCRLIDSSCLPDIQAKPTPYCCTYRSAPSSSRVFSESRIDGRTAYRRETRALLGIVEIFHRIGRRTPCTVARFIYTFSLCTWSFWILQNAAVISLNYYFNVKFLFLRFSWSLFLIFNFHMEENNNCYIIEIRNRKQNFHAYFLKLNKKKRKYSLEIFPHTESEIHPRKPNSKLCYLKRSIRALFYIPIAKSRLYIYRVSRPLWTGWSGFYSRPWSVHSTRKREGSIYTKDSSDHLYGRIVTGHPVEWSIGGGQRVLRWQSVSDGGLSRYGSTTPQTSILKPS